MTSFRLLGGLFAVRVTPISLWQPLRSTAIACGANAGGGDVAGSARMAFLNEICFAMVPQPTSGEFATLGPLIPIGQIP
jgi:nitrate/nitrite transporter NarK